jgi:hypothetical protein
MTKDEVLDLALEALESADWYINQLEITLYSDDDAGTHEYRLKVQQAITAIKQALAAPVQELTNLQRHEQNVQKFLAAQPTPVQEPVAWMEVVVANLVREGVNKHKARELAEHFYGLAPAAQRTWVGLTVEEKNEITWGKTIYEILELFEAKLKEKNNG